MMRVNCQKIVLDPQMTLKIITKIKYEVIMNIKGHSKVKNILLKITAHYL